MQNAKMRRRYLQSKIFHYLCAAATWFAITILAILLFHIGREGYNYLSINFLTHYPSRFPARAGVKSALYGTLWLISFTAMISIPVGISAAIYLEEYAPKNRLSRIIEINIANLAGIPSIIYGILGMTIFVRFMGLGRSILAGSLTMSLLVLPVVIIASREAIRAVPSSMRQASYALGATRWQTISHHVIPASLPGIMTGVILAMSRAIGETAPLLMIGALTFVAFTPDGPMDSFTALPIQIFNWSSRPQKAFYELAASGIIVLLVILFIMNALAVFIRTSHSKKVQ